MSVYVSKMRVFHGDFTSFENGRRRKKGKNCSQCNQPILYSGLPVSSISLQRIWEDAEMVILAENA